MKNVVVFLPDDWSEPFSVELSEAADTVEITKNTAKATAFNVTLVFLQGLNLNFDALLSKASILNTCQVFFSIGVSQVESLLMFGFCLWGCAKVCWY